MKSNKYKIEFYKTFWKQWRWRIKASNGKIIGASTESFKNKSDCEHNLIINGLAIKQYKPDDE